MESDNSAIIEKLERLEKLAESNNRLLRIMRREVLWSRFFKVIYLLIIIGVPVAIYYYIQPYLGALGDSDSILKTLEKAKSLSL